MCQLVDRIDLELLKINEILNALQPPRTGKIRVVFEKNRHKKLKPVPVKWIRINKNDIRWRLARLGAKGLCLHACSSTSFKTYHSVVADHLRHVTYLMTLRAKVLDAMENYKKAIRGLERWHLPKLDELKFNTDLIYEGLGNAPAEFRGPDNVPDTIDGYDEADGSETIVDD